MDILTHTLSGLAVGTVVASFSNKGFGQKLSIILIAGFAGALPDVDAISLWSGFDTIFGNFFNLSHTGREIYSGKLWYSHHAFMHSLFAGILFTLIIAFVKYLVRTKRKRFAINPLTDSLKHDKLILLGFLTGFLIHLLEDMPTPASSWGGVNFLWPSSSYMGGTGDIWWWNNYDIFLIVGSVLIINLMLLMVKRIMRFDARKLSLVVLLAGFILIMVQTKTRAYDFAYNGHAKNYQEFESKSLEIQKAILGKKLFHVMESFDNRLKIYF